MSGSMVTKWLVYQCDPVNDPHPRFLNGIWDDELGVQTYIDSAAEFSPDYFFNIVTAQIWVEDE